MRVAIEDFELQILQRHEQAARPAQHAVSVTRHDTRDPIVFVSVAKGTFSSMVFWWKMLISQSNNIYILRKSIWIHLGSWSLSIYKCLSAWTIAAKENGAPFGHLRSFVPHFQFSVWESPVAHFEKEFKASKICYRLWKICHLSRLPWKSMNCC